MAILITQTFRRRAAARLAFLESSVSEICKAWGAFGVGVNGALMKPYRYRRVMSSENPTLHDYATISEMLGVDLRALLFEEADVSQLEDVGEPPHLIRWRTSAVDPKTARGTANG